MRTLRHREVKQPAQGHKDIKCWSLTLKPVLFIIILPISQMRQSRQSEATCPAYVYKPSKWSDGTPPRVCLAPEPKFCCWQQIDRQSNPTPFNTRVTHWVWSLERKQLLLFISVLSASAVQSTVPQRTLQEWVKQRIVCITWFQMHRKSVTSHTWEVIPLTFQLWKCKLLCCINNPSLKRDAFTRLSFRWKGK